MLLAIYFYVNGRMVGTDDLSISYEIPMVSIKMCHGVPARVWQPFSILKYLEFHCTTTPLDKFRFFSLEYRNLTLLSQERCEFVMERLDVPTLLLRNCCWLSESETAELRHICLWLVRTSQWIPKLGIIYMRIIPDINPSCLTHTGMDSSPKLLLHPEELFSHSK